MNDIDELQTFDPSKGKGQIDILQQQYDELNKTKLLLEDMKAKGEVIDEEYLQNITDQTKEAQEELAEAEKYFNDKRHSYFSEEVNLMGDDFKESLFDKTVEAGEGITTQLTTDVQNAIENINSEIASTPMNSIIIPVKYQFDNMITSLGAMTSMIGASYDDSIEEGSMFTPFTSGASSFMAEARATLQNVQSRIAGSIMTLPIIENRVVSSEGKKVEVHQSNVFNVPVQKPSDVTRAIEKLNRELAKKL